MQQLKNTWMSWSTGKDSAFALFTLQQEQRFKVTSLLTTITEPYNRVSMHGVREELLNQQAYQLKLPIQKIRIPSVCTNEIYQEQMQTVIADAQKQNIQYIGFGDIFLEDIKQYRIDMMKKSQIKPVFPLWGMSSKHLAESIITSGIKAVVTCVDLNKLPLSFLGKEYDNTLLHMLPDSVDPCGENGEFHTFVYNSPLFANPIPIITGECVMSENFAFCDIRAPGSC